MPTPTASTMHSTKQKKPRTGRANQCYREDTGARLVAGCVCINASKSKIVMILLAAHRDRWILPKGGVESDESHDYSLTAERETWEEAGVEGCIVRKLPIVFDSRGSKAPVIRGDFDFRVQVPKSEFHFYEMVVDSLHSEWPESALRHRRWCTFAEAKHELERAKRPELVSVLEASSMVKDVF